MRGEKDIIPICIEEETHWMDGKWLVCPIHVLLLGRVPRLSTLWSCMHCCYFISCNIDKATLFAPMAKALVCLLSNHMLEISYVSSASLWEWGFSLIDIQASFLEVGLHQQLFLCLISLQQRRVLHAIWMWMEHKLSRCCRVMES